jgi:antirestriction protein ArdC
MPSQHEIRQRVTDEIIEALKQGVTPWSKPWQAPENSGLPANVISKRRYTGVNPLLLELSARKKGFTSKWWGTFRQWQGLNCHVMARPKGVEPGKWGTKVVFFKPIKTVRKTDDGEEKESTFPLLREYVLFNADQVEGEAVEKFRAKPPQENGFVDFGPAEEIIRATGADIRHRHGDEAAYYYPPNDFIILPLKSQFGDNQLAYYDVAFHELAHFSEPRLGWKPDQTLSPKEKYAIRELRADIAAAYLSSEVGIPSLTSHAQYLDSWIRAMQEDYRIIFRVSSAASAAVDYLLSFSRKEAEAPETEEVLAA